MPFDFDTPLSLRNTHCSKWDAIGNVFKDLPEQPPVDEVIPMWVADMDFAAAPPILAALQAEVSRGYMGYFTNDRPIAELVSQWMETQHGWTTDPDWVRFTRGVIEGVALAVETFSNRGDEVIVFSPVYHAFYGKVRALGRVIKESPLVLEDGAYRMDLDALATSLSGKEKIVILCSPHNPGGRLWSQAELAAVAAFCERHGLILVSDEIHMDLTFPGETYLPTGRAAPESYPHLMMLSAASKGFNIAGGETGFAIIPDPALREAVDAVRPAVSGTMNRFGMAMTKAAFAEGAEWSLAARHYIADNFAIWRERISALPGIQVMDMPSTYLSWVDFSGTGMQPSEVRLRLGRDARIATNPGAQFGTGGEMFNRFNIAMPRPLMMTAIERMEAAFADLQ
ncbi:MAG: PatB family C-S lyase [Pseudomonadota bacterium]